VGPTGEEDNFGQNLSCQSLFTLFFLYAKRIINNKCIRIFYFGVILLVSSEAWKYIFLKIDSVTLKFQWTIFEQVNKSSSWYLQGQGLCFW